MPTPLQVTLEGDVRQAWRNVALAFSHCEGGRGGEEGGEGRRGGGYKKGEESVVEGRRGGGKEGRVQGRGGMGES